MIPDSVGSGDRHSEEALAVARENAARNGAEVDFRLADALGDLRWLGTFDAIVSNPPYVPRSDRASMHTNVRDYEPSGRAVRR